MNKPNKIRDNDYFSFIIQESYFWVELSVWLNGRFSDGTRYTTEIEYKNFFSRRFFQPKKAWEQAVGKAILATLSLKARNWEELVNQFLAKECPLDGSLLRWEVRVGDIRQWVKEDEEARIGRATYVAVTILE